MTVPHVLYFLAMLAVTSQDGDSETCDGGPGSRSACHLPYPCMFLGLLLRGRGNGSPPSLPPTLSSSSTLHLFISTIKSSTVSFVGSVIVTPFSLLLFASRASATPFGRPSHSFCRLHLSLPSNSPLTNIHTRPPNPQPPPSCSCPSPALFKYRDTS